MEDRPGVARRISDRHFGIGSDGLILICPSEAAVVRMEMYNADGSRGVMCGNGIRCVAKYAYEHGLTDRATIPIETDAGIKEAVCTITDGKVTRVKIDMGPPALTPRDVGHRSAGDRVVDVPIELNGRRLRMTCVSMGNPHAVIFVDDLDGISLRADGPSMENHPQFEDRVNAHFVRVDGRDRVTVLTWERGSGRTLACGTGASAVCVAGVLTDRTESRITAVVPGGELDLFWDRERDNHVYMTGPAVEAFTGDWLEPAGRST
jgi:diaminopimelate epimerase